MSLIAFHRFLIAAGILFCFGFAAWEVRAWLGSGDATQLVIAMGFALLGAGLVVYLRRLTRILGLDRMNGEGVE
jgi:hypothetical protein